MKEKNALIYGATGGLGSAICQELRKRGTNLFLIGRSRQRLKQLSDELEIKSSQTFCVKTITTEAEFQKADKWVRDLGVNLDFGVHAAGQGLMKKAIKLSLKEWSSLIDVNLTSSFAFYKLFWNSRQTDHCDLVFFSSASLNQSWPKNGLYGASKAGLEAFLQSLQQEVKNEGGRIWLYKPGSVDTNFFNNVKNHLPREKMLKAKEVASIVVDNLEIDPRIFLPVVPILSE